METVYGKVIKNKNQTRIAIFEYIEIGYNRKRMHSSLGYMTPLRKANEIYSRKLAA